jgi:hypothetical protein
VIEENAKIARENVLKQDTLETLHSQVLIARQELQELKRVYDSKACDQLEKDATRFSPKIIIEVLRSASTSPLSTCDRPCRGPP